MRHLIKPAQLDTTAIETLTSDPKSRDNIEAVFKGLQHLYMYHWPELEAVFEAEFCPDVDGSNGRPGMDVGSILVAGVLKPGIDCDFDRLYSLVNHHGLVHTMMSHDDGFAWGRYEFQTLVDNVALLTPALLERVGQLLVASGHKVARKKPGAALRSTSDGFGGVRHSSPGTSRAGSGAPPRTRRVCPDGGSGGAGGQWPPPGAVDPPARITPPGAPPFGLDTRIGRPDDRCGVSRKRDDGRIRRLRGGFWARKAV